MNTRVVAIAAVILLAVIVTMIMTIVFISAITKGSSVPMPVGPVKSEDTKPLTGYAIPERPAPGLQEVDDSIKKENERRDVAEKASAEINKEKEKRRKMQTLQERDEITEETVSEAPAVEEKKKDAAVVLPEKKEVTFPTAEEVEKMRSRGVIAY